MKKLVSSRFRPLLYVLLVAAALLFAAQTAVAQGKYKPGDRVECNTIGDDRYQNGYEKGTVLAFRPSDQPDGSWYRVKADVNKVEYYCELEHIRPIAGGQTTGGNAGGNNAGGKGLGGSLGGLLGGGKTGGSNPTAGKFVDCPPSQKKVKNGAAPNAELFKKLIRCAKGEKSVEEGDEAAVKVDIAGLEIGAARPWRYNQDIGNGKVGTLVYPVKATYTISTFYRTATEVEEGWIRIFNFYVNAFGEWAIGSQENVKSPKVRRINR